MDNSELSFLFEGSDHPRLDFENNAPADTPQPPLSEQETIGVYRTIQAEREKRTTLEKRLADLTMNDSNTSFGALDHDLSAKVYANNLRVSRRFAEREHGREVIAAVHNWASDQCDADPEFNNRMRASDDPYEAAKQAYDRERAFKSATPTSPEEPRASVAPPRSLADAPGNGAIGKPHVPVGDGNAYQSLFR